MLKLVQKWGEIDLELCTCIWCTSVGEWWTIHEALLIASCLKCTLCCPMLLLSPNASRCHPPPHSQRAPLGAWSCSTIATSLLPRHCQEHKRAFGLTRVIISKSTTCSFLQFTLRLAPMPKGSHGHPCHPILYLFIQSSLHYLGAFLSLLGLDKGFCLACKTKLVGFN